jgi:hypothetical protein
MRTLQIAVVCAIGFVPGNAIGSVSVGNGNYFIAFTDIELLDGAGHISISLSRTYNSRTQFRGMLGYGWGNDFDTYLIPSADGSIVVQESGGGEKLRLQRPGFNAMELGLLVGRIVEAKASKAPGEPQFDKSAYQLRLMGDADFRDEEARELGVMRELPVGTVLYSTKHGDQQRVIRTEKGYIRHKGGGTSEFFEFKGTAFDQGVDSAEMRKLNGIYKLTRTENTIAKTHIAFSHDLSSGNLLQ